MYQTKFYFVYIMTNWNNKVMYVGITSNLRRRVYAHKNKVFKGFTQKYNINKLVYFEIFQDIHVAIKREKEIKKWRREKKNKIVQLRNPKWRDLNCDFE